MKAASRLSRHGPRFRLCSLVAVSLMLGFVAPSWSQSVAPNPPVQPVIDDDVAVLSPFEVSGIQDRGYIASRASSVTKTDTPMIELPHTVQVLNKEFLQDTGATTLHQAVRFVSNVVGGDTRGDVGLQIRGFGATRLRNGQQYPSITYNEQASFERVEVIKGASAVLYGTSAPGGIINVVDKRPLPKRQAEILLQAGSYDFYKAVFDFTGPLLTKENFALNYRAIGAVEDSESWRVGAFRERKYFSGSLEARLASRTIIILRTDYQEDKMLESFTKPWIWFPPSSTTGVLLNLPDNFLRGEPTDRKRVETFNGELTVEHHFSPNWVLRSTSVYNDAFDFRREIFIANQGPDINFWPRNLQEIPNDRQTLISEVNLLGKLDLGPTKHQILAGVNVLDDELHQANFRFNLDPPTFPIFAPVYGVAMPTTEVLGVRRASRSETKSSGYFLQDQIQLFGDRLHLVLGVRKDRLRQKVFNLRTGTMVPNNDDQTSPRWAALWRASRGLSAYVSYNESFVPASGATSFQGVPFPSPTAEQTEVGVKFELLSGRLNGSAAAFENVRRNQTTTDPVNPSFSVATGEVKSTGFEFDIAAELTPNWQVIIGAGWLDARITKDNVPARIGRGFGGIPDFTASGWTKYEFKQGALAGFVAGAGFVHEAERWIDNNNTATVPGYTIFNTMLGYKWGRYRVVLNIENLLDKSYVVRPFSPRAVLPGDARQWKLQFARSF